jgi:hypothetical protein
VLRVVEWRARRVADPAQRLQFLQSRMARGSGNPHRWRKGAFNRVPAPAITLGLALAGAALLQPWGSSPVVAKVDRSRSTSGKLFPRPSADSQSRVWLVQAGSDSDLYSNGLRVENQFATSSAARKYLAFASAELEPGAGEWRTEPAGIVFHTTESHMAPFEEDQNRVLRREGDGVLEYVSRRRSYHFVIDRFGRVFRIVREGDYANHAGNSIWADDHWVYLNLNQSFFGVAFEAQSNPDGLKQPVNPAQVHAGRILVEMLRARYGIAGKNCVAHAQVSVNPGNGRAGYHTDWAANLPFRELGLGDNYQSLLPSVTLFGFDPDAGLAAAGGAPLGQGLQSSEEQLQANAAVEGLPLDRYRQQLQQRYREAIAARRSRGVPEENN